MNIKNCAFGIFQKGLALKGLQAYPKQNVSVVFRKFSEWHIVSALCLERKPVITQPLTPLEQRYLEFVQKLEIEKSYLSDHEKRQKEDKRIAEKLRKGDVEDADVILNQTAQDFEDSSLEEFNKFQPAPRITDADLNNDRQSIQRKLDSSLVLVVNQRLGNDFRWVLPQTVHKEGETLRQTAERALHEVCPNPPKIMLLGNAPVGFYKYKYPKLLRGNGICGAKVFFFKAQLRPLQQDKLVIESSEHVENHLWLTHSELKEVFQPVYCKVIKSFLFPDTFDVDSRDSLSSTHPNEDQLSSVSHQT